jgi:putative ABC transport system ATP-binding protein/lipoprotein-releasing system ATP-binding protein
VIDEADTIAVVGPSGSGKSTLLHLVAGLEPATTGSIAWPAIGDRTALRPGPIGIAFQGPSLLPPLTVRENVALPAILAGRTDAGASGAALELLDAFGAADLAERLPDELSGGQAQRVGFARAFAGSPRLVLDVLGGAALMTMALTLTRLRGAALVVATHDPAIAERLGARWLMRDGTLHREAVPSSA